MKNILLVISMEYFLKNVKMINESMLSELLFL